MSKIEDEESNKYLFEVIDGVVYDMSPSPNTNHQRISGRLFQTFANYLAGKPCEVFSAPFDVYPNESSSDCVIPDLSVICDATKIHDDGCHGAPDLVVEILSKSTAANDRTVKLKLYRACGVKEYWIVDPNFYTVEVYNFAESMFSPSNNYTVHDTIKVGIFEDLDIDLNTIFASLD